MRQTFHMATVFLLIAGSVLPQTAPTASFEVASIKRSAVVAGSWCRFLAGGRLSATAWVKLLIQIAYGVEDYQVVGGPAWLTSDRYEIEAKAENSNAAKTEMLGMLRSLLADRFQLRLRRETREFNVYSLLVDKGGPRLVPLKEGEASRCGRNNSAICGITSVEQLAAWLKYVVGRPVLDETGVRGRFDVLIDFDTYTTQGRTPPPDYDKPSLQHALSEQLGLRLENKKAPFPVLVIESIERPSGN